VVSLSHTLKTKGAINTFKRAIRIYSRYSFNRFLKSMNSMLDLLDDFDAYVTFPITAITLQRNIDTIKEFRTRGIEWAMHGYVHVDYTQLPLQKVEKHIVEGKKIFKSAGIKLYGFRAPYLKSNEKILGVLKKHDFIYDSSQSFFVPVIPVNKSVKIILEYYNPIEKWELKNVNGILEIPVSLPDDEILVDRLGYGGDKIGEVWIKMCRELIRIGGIPVIQLHPERGKLCYEGLKKVLEWASKNDFEILPLKDLAKHTGKKSISITGDVDIVKISDLRYMRA